MGFLPNLNLFQNAFRKHSTGRSRIWLFYLAAVTLVIGFIFRDWGYDDPFITYRYAANLAHGLGLVYNPGERVLSTTTLLWSLLLAPFAALNLDLRVVSVVLGAACLGLGGLSLWSLGTAARQPWLGWAGLLLYPLHPLVIFSLSSETPLYLALVLGALALAAQQRLRMAAVLAGLAVLARPDGLLAAALVALLAAFDLVRAWWTDQGWIAIRTGNEQRPAENRRRGWQAFFIMMGVILPVWGWAWGDYGSPLPVTLVAKQQQGVMAISDSFLTGFWKLVGQYWAVGYGRVELLLGGLGLAYAVWLIARAAKENWNPREAAQTGTVKQAVRPLVLLAAWTAAYFAAYVLLGVTRYFWYYAPLAPGWVAAQGLGLAAVAHLVTALGAWLFPLMRTAGSGVGNKAELASAAALAAALCSAVLLLWLGVEQMVRIAQVKPDERLAVYRQVGEWLAVNTPATARVGLLEVGVIGYYANRSVIDFAGLIQPQTAAQFSRETTYEDAALWAVSTYQPEYLVLHAGLFPRLEAQIGAEPPTVGAEPVPAEFVPHVYCQEVQRFPGLQLDMVVYACQR